MKTFACLFLGAVLALGLGAGRADAALVSKKMAEAAAKDPKAAYNPHEAAGDLELPMPNGMRLVVRPVGMLTNGVIYDHPFKMGLTSPEDKRGFYERQFPAHVSAPFRLTDLPPAWKERIPKLAEGAAGNDAGPLYYFIGKYELTNGQWDAVMGGESGQPNLPKTDISWYDMQEFLRKYNEWLLSNHADAVPAIDGVPAFLRLPNETEWEFAARGGYLAPEIQEGREAGVDGDIRDYAVFGEGVEGLRPIGTRKPNDLGLYDMSGNAGEMVQGGFRMIVAENKGGGAMARPHGSEGGLVSKGGNYLAKNEVDVYPGKRDEMVMFKKGSDGSYAPFHDRNLGARLLLTSVNVPGSPRTQIIVAEENNASKTPELQGAKKKASSQPASPAVKEGVIILEPGTDPLVALTKISEATQSPLVKSNLVQLEGLLKTQNEAFNRERDSNLLSSVRSVVYMADSLANIAFRCFEVENAWRRAKGLAGFNKDMEKKFIASRDEHFKNLLRSTNIYRVNVGNLADVDKDELNFKIRQLRGQYQGNDKLNTNFRKNLDTFAKHVDLVKKKGTGALTDKVIWEEVIPQGKMQDVVRELAAKKK